MFVWGITMREKITDKISKIRCYNKKWFNRFIVMLEECGVERSVINKAVKLIMDDDNKYAPTMGNWGVFLNNPTIDRKIENFFTYMEQLALDKGTDEFRAMLERVIFGVEKNFLDLKESNEKITTNFFNLVMRQLLLENPQDAILIDTNDKEQAYGGRLDLVLGGVSVGHVSFGEESSDQQLVVFDDFRTLPGLEKMGIGSHLFRGLCKKVMEEKPGYSIAAWGVMKGRDGEKAYIAWGGLPVASISDIAEGRILTSEEYDNAPRSLIYYFTNDIVRENAIKENNRYGTKKSKHDYMGE